ncbi:riboflavin synthase, alpha subunit [Opitutaceae bacterium TAV1]|nr:riboflavin synthase subunit alpha [Opitutaceae bacterium TAV5]EIQ00621.1 riboflavin synthase, alpha subunit [Opitutaceae bacterium TAV1]
MFTGIIEETGTVESFTKGDDAWKLRLATRLPREDIAPGDSIAINGCCLTVTGFDADFIRFDLLEETYRLTNIGKLAPGSAVNLECSLRFGGKMGGHFVTGHIDGQGVIEIFEQRGSDYYLRVKAPAGTGLNLIEKGSIAIDGISLTVAEVEGDTFAVWLIPTTITVTNLRTRRPGDHVNLEFDMLGKYVQKLAAAHLVGQTQAA